MTRWAPARVMPGHKFAGRISVGSDLRQAPAYWPWPIRVPQHQRQPVLHHRGSHRHGSTTHTIFGEVVERHGGGQDASPTRRAEQDQPTSVVTMKKVTIGEHPPKAVSPSAQRIGLQVRNLPRSRGFLGAPPNPTAPVSSALIGRPKRRQIDPAEPADGPGSWPSSAPSRRRPATGS